MRTVRNFLPLVLLFLTPLLTPAAAPPDRHPDITRQVRELEAKIKEVRGLGFDKPVVFRVISRPKEADPGVQGYYDVRQKALFLYDDIKGNYRKGVLIHEMVHALQDQHFGLKKLHGTSFDSDADLALAALIEGDAMYTTIEMLQKEQPNIAKMLETSLEKSRNIQNAFVYGVGAAYVKQLKQRGGWSAVNSRYLFTPTSTAAILHPEQRVTAANLGPGRRVGEFGIVKLFHSNPATQADCSRAAAGWRGDRTIEEHGGSAWLVAFATPEQAGLFEKTLIALRTAEYPKLKREVADGATVWKGQKTRRSIERRGNRVLEVAAPDEKAAAALQDRAYGPPRYEVYSAAEKKLLTFGELTDRIMDARIICVGENHDDELHHAAQLAVIKAIYARDERLGVGMEMFQRVRQKGLDRYFSGATDEGTMLEDTDYKKRWGYDWALYKPIVDFCKRNQVPLAALNVSDELRKRVREVGVEKLTDKEKKDLGEIDFAVKEHREHWLAFFGKMDGHGEMSPALIERMVRAMTIWDEYMADSAVKFLTERKLRRVVVLAGAGHIERNFGIPNRATKRGGKAVSVRVQVGGDLEKVRKEPLADFVLIVR